MNPIKLANQFLSLAEKKPNTWQGEKYLIDLSRRYNSPIQYPSPNSPPTTDDIILILESYAKEKLKVSEFQRSLIKGRVLKAVNNNQSSILLYPEFAEKYARSLIMPRIYIHVSWAIRTKDDPETNSSSSYVFVKCSLVKPESE